MLIIGISGYADQSPRVSSPKTGRRRSRGALLLQRRQLMDSQHEDDGVEVEEEESDQETGQPGAAEAAVRQAEAEGLTLKVEDHQQRVPRSDRSGEVIEPMVSAQWCLGVKKSMPRCSKRSRRSC